MRWAVALVFLASCAPEHVVWYGKTPDRSTSVRVLERSGAQRVEIAGKSGEDHGAIGIEGLALTKASQAYPVLDGGRWRVVHDGKTLDGAWDAIGDVRLSPDGHHVAWSVLEKKQWTVMADGVRLTTFDGIVRGTLQIDDDGRASFVGKKDGLVWVADGKAMIGPQRAVRGLRRKGELAFVAVMPDGERVIEGGKSSERFDEVLEWIDGGFVARAGKRMIVEARGKRLHDGGPAGALSVHGDHFAYVVDDEGGERIIRDGRDEPAPWEAVLATSLGENDRFACVARRGSDELVVIDGVETGAWAWATAPIFSDDGAHWAYVASMGAGALVVTDRGRTAYDVVLADTLAFDARGRLGAVVGYASNRSVWIAVDRKPQIRIDLEEWAAEALRTRHVDLRGWVRAELAHTR
jgi:hypothetical protein